MSGSDNVIAMNRAVRSSDRGFDIRCSNSVIWGNNAHSNGYGIVLFDASDDYVLNNDCSGNKMAGLLVDSTCKNITSLGNV